eukprot:5628711-Pyramimonas_sp.AAC.1
MTETDYGVYGNAATRSACWVSGPAKPVCPDVQTCRSWAAFLSRGAAAKPLNNRSNGRTKPPPPPRDVTRPHA